MRWLNSTQAATLDLDCVSWECTGCAKAVNANAGVKYAIADEKHVMFSSKACISTCQR